MWALTHLGERKRMGRIRQITVFLFCNQEIHYHPEFSSKFRKMVCGTEQL